MRKYFRKIKTRRMFKKLLKFLRLNPRTKRLAIFVLLFATVGSLLLIASQAASPNKYIEPENGTVAFPGKVNPEPAASGGSAVQFGLRNRTRLGVDLNRLPPGITTDTAYSVLSFIGFGMARTSVFVGGYTDLNPNNFDNELANAKRVNVKVLVTVTYAYGTTGCSDGHCAPSDPTAWANYVGKLVNRWKTNYPGVVVAVEVWNEANNPQFWNPVNPVAYTDLLKKTYTAVKAADSSVKVIFSGPAPGGGNKPASQTTNVTNPATFVQQIYANGGKNFFDAGANHPYDTYHLTQNAPGTGPRNNFYIREIMDANGDQTKQLWATESGTVSCTHGTGSNPPFTEAQRSLRLTLDLQDFWHGVHEHDKNSSNYGGTINTNSPTGDLNAGPFFIFKLYKTPGDSGDGIIYNTNAWMKNPPAGEEPDGPIEPICTTAPDYYVPGSNPDAPGIVNSIVNFSEHLQRVP